MEQKEKGWAAKAGANLGSGIINGLHYAADLGEEALKGASKGILDIVDIGGDVAAAGTDIATNLVTGGHGTDINNGDGFLDKSIKGKEGIKAFIDKNDSVKSQWGESKAGKGGLKVTDFLGSVAAPGFGELAALGKAFQGIKMGKNAIMAMKNSPKVIEELTGLAKLGKKVEQSQVDDIFAKYGVGAVEKAMDATKVPKALQKLIDAKMTPAQIEEIAKTDGIIKKAWDAMKTAGAATTKGAIAITLGEGTKMKNADDDNMLPPADEEKATETKTDEKKISEERKSELLNKNQVKTSQDGKVTVTSKDGVETTYPNMDAAVADIDINNKPDTSTTKIDVNHPDEKKAIATFEELKKANPNLNITTSISDYMRARKLDPSFLNRGRLAEKFGIKNYMGTGAQNIELFKKIQEEDDNTLTM